MSAREYPVPATKRMGAMLVTERCPRCKVAVVATDYRELEPSGAQRPVFLDARYARDVVYEDGTMTETLAPEHRCEGRGKKSAEDGLWD